MRNLSGIFPPITTPFAENGDLLIDSFSENLSKWASSRLAGVTVLGSNGESPYLSDDEKLLLVREVRQHLGPDKTLIAGAGRESTRLCIDFIGKIANLGVDYALVGTPCYFKPRMGDEELFAHYSRIADASPIPILIYNVPQFTGINTSAGLIAKLARHENIAGIKESSANLALQADIRRQTNDRFQILVGSAPTLLPSLIQGACGGVVAIACALPELIVDLYEAFYRGDWKHAATLQERISPPAAAVTTLFGVPGLKAALDLMGYFGGWPRLPLLPLDAAKRANLKSIFQAASLL